VSLVQLRTDRAFVPVMLSAAKHLAANAANVPPAHGHRPAAITCFSGRSPAAIDRHRTESNKILRFAQDDSGWKADARGWKADDSGGKADDSGGKADARGGTVSARLMDSDQRPATTTP